MKSHHSPHAGALYKVIALQQGTFGVSGHLVCGARLESLLISRAVKSKIKRL